MAAAVKLISYEQKSRVIFDFWFLIHFLSLSFSSRFSGGVSNSVCLLSAILFNKSLVCSQLANSNLSNVLNNDLSTFRLGNEPLIDGAKRTLRTAFVLHRRVSEPCSQFEPYHKSFSSIIIVKSKLQLKRVNASRHSLFNHFRFDSIISSGWS